jgi:hypothetical protein
MRRRHALNRSSPAPRDTRRHREIGLHLLRCASSGDEGHVAREADERVQLVDRAVGLDAKIVLRRVPPKSDVSPLSPVRV